jgi:hypothetical protein
MWSAVDIDSQKMMNVPKIRHGELTVEGINDVLQGGGGASGEDDVVNIQKEVCSSGGGAEHKE